MPGINDHSKIVIKSYSQLIAAQSLYYRCRLPIRNAIVNTVSFFKKCDIKSDWIWFPYYHHVFDDEREGFRRQIAFLKKHGDIIALEQAVSLLSSQEKFKGRYFCITFDDGLHSCYTNAVPILSELKAVAAFFVVVNYTSDIADNRIVRPLYPGQKFSFEYLTWSECREMIAYGMTIGAHSMSHEKLSMLSEEQAKKDFEYSKSVIENKTGKACYYYACPWGTPGKSYNDQREPRLARAAGYKALLTTKRGRNLYHQDIFALQRDHVYANWSNLQLRYFMSI